MIQMIPLISLTLLCSPSHAVDSSFFSSAAARVLGKYPEGNRAINDLKSGGKLSDVEVVQLPIEKIQARTGHTGGGVKQDPVTNKYSILVRNDLSPEQMAQAIAHELQHIRDEKEADAYFEQHPDLNALGPKVIRGLRLPEPERRQFVLRNVREVDFVMKALFCQELRAYKTTQNLQTQGLSYANEEFNPTNPANYINDKYLRPLGADYSNTQVKDFERECNAQEKFASYLDSVAPKTSAPMRFGTAPAVQ